LGGRRAPDVRAAVLYTDRPITAAEFAAMLAHERYEFVLGRLVPVAPASTEHGELGANLTRLVMNHVYDNKLGRAYIAETGFDITRPGDEAPQTLSQDDELDGESVLPGFRCPVAALASTARRSTAR